MRTAFPPRIHLLFLAGNVAFLAAWVLVLRGPEHLWLAWTLVGAFLAARIGGAWYHLATQGRGDPALRRAALFQTGLALAATAALLYAWRRSV